MAATLATPTVIIDDAFETPSTVKMDDACLIQPTTMSRHGMGGSGVRGRREKNLVVSHAKKGSHSFYG